VVVAATGSTPMPDCDRLIAAVLAHAGSPLVPHCAEWDDDLEDLYALAAEMHDRNRQEQADG
jgi:hypothetical protein